MWLQWSDSKSGHGDTTTKNKSTLLNNINMRISQKY